MPLPDAKPDRRIYELLKTTDLENLTFSDFQGVAEKIYAEQGAEDELRRIVLVNLARLAVVGEWTGLTDAGGGGITRIAPATLAGYSSGIYLSGINPAQQVGITGSYNVSIWEAAPFYATETGTLGTLKIRVNNAGTGSDMDVAIYDSDDNGFPQTLQSTGSIDTDSTGVQSTALSAAAGGSTTVTAGELYWFAHRARAGASVDPRFWCNAETTATAIFAFEATAGNAGLANVILGNNAASAPSSFPTNGLGASKKIPFAMGVIT